MIPKSINQITEQDLQTLIDNSVLEGKTIEYKQELPGSSDTDKKEFLADVSSFANASGGDLIYGITEDRTAGIPKKLEGLTITNVGEEILRLESTMRDGIKPRILINTQHINLPNSKVALIIRVPKSWISPHRVIFKGHDKFYSRSTNGKYPMDVGELRSAFNLSETLTERIRNFRVDRISKILANETTPEPLNDTAKIVLHLIPVISFNPAQRYEISDIASHPEKMPPINGSPTLTLGRYNLDGFLTYYRQEDLEGKSCFYSYVQLFNNGIVEAVEGELLNPNRHRGELSIPSIAYEKALINSVSDYLGILKLLNVDLPIIIFLTLIGVKGYYMGVRGWLGSGSNTRIDRDILPLPERVLESYDNDAKDVLRHCFDSIWNACGYPRSENYDGSGKWIAR